ncbi:MAG: flagellar hook-basal body complex protein FliE [Gemmatimonadota bacterium]
MAIDAIRQFSGLQGSGSATQRVSPLEVPVRGLPNAEGRGDQVEKQGFHDLVKSFAADVNDLQFEAGHAIDMLVTGEAADVHQVMVAVEQAGIALDLMLEVRNRVLEGYQELIRMQV